MTFLERGLSECQKLALLTSTLRQDIGLSKTFSRPIISGDFVIITGQIFKFLIFELPYPLTAKPQRPPTAQKKGIATH